MGSGAVRTRRMGEEGGSRNEVDERKTGVEEGGAVRKRLRGEITKMPFLLFLKVIRKNGVRRLSKY